MVDVVVLSCFWVVLSDVVVVYDDVMMVVGGTVVSGVVSGIPLPLPLPVWFVVGVVDGSSVVVGVLVIVVTEAAHTVHADV